LLRGEVVSSLGNTALSFGYQEMGWGTGTYASLSQGDNAQPFPALRVQNIHPSYLPWLLRYLGPFRGQAFFGELDHGRTFSRPWLSGQIVSFKPLPTFEFGLTHAIMFGGRGNDDYGAGGFIGRLTGFSTGNAATANTNSRAGIYLKFYFPSLRNLQVYQEILGEDNLTNEVRPIGGLLPFLAVSYQGGVYLPRLTEDGLTTARFEYAIIEPNYSTHSDSLFWTYHNRLMGDPLGPNSSRVDLALGRWLAEGYKTEGDLFYTERAPRFGVAGLLKERSGGFALDLLSLPALPGGLDGALGALKTRVATEYVSHINYSRNTGSIRVGLVISAALMPTRESSSWR
jgi:capsule assembly protein Wzi